MSTERGAAEHADGGTPPPAYEVIGTTAAIAVHRLDLTAPPEELRAKVSALAAMLGPTATDKTLRMVETA